MSRHFFDGCAVALTIRPSVYFCGPRYLSGDRIMRYVAVLLLGMTSSNAGTSTKKSGWRKPKLLRNESQIVTRITFPACRTAEYQDPALRNVTPFLRRAKADATDLTSSSLLRLFSPPDLQGVRSATSVHGIESVMPTNSYAGTSRSSVKE